MNNNELTPMASANSDLPPLHGEPSQILQLTFPSPVSTSTSPLVPINPCQYPQSRSAPRNLCQYLPSQDVPRNPSSKNDKANSPK